MLVSNLSIYHKYFIHFVVFFFTEKLQCVSMGQRANVDLCSFHRCIDNKIMYIEFLFLFQVRISCKPGSKNETHEIVTE